MLAASWHIELHDALAHVPARRELDEPKERAALAGHGGAAFARGDEPL